MLKFLDTDSIVYVSFLPFGEKNPQLGSIWLFSCATFFLQHHFQVNNMSNKITLDISLPTAIEVDN